MANRRRGARPCGATSHSANAYNKSKHTAISAVFSCTERLCKRSNSGEWDSFWASIASRAALTCGISTCLAYQVAPSMTTQATVIQGAALGANTLTREATDRQI